MKCKCKDPICKQEVVFDTLSHTMMFNGSLIYLDANGCIEMIQELKKCLKSMADEP